jgi:uncharacterized protein
MFCAKPKRVLTETCYLLMARGGSRAQSAFLRSVGEGFAEVFVLGSYHFLRMAELMERYQDLLNMADASLVVLAEQLEHGRILTVDRRDFNVYRWSDRNTTWQVTEVEKTIAKLAG